jgi:hypothetical protein
LEDCDIEKRGERGKEEKRRRGVKEDGKKGKNEGKEEDEEDLKENGRVGRNGVKMERGVALKSSTVPTPNPHRDDHSTVRMYNDIIFLGQKREFHAATG